MAPREGSEVIFPEFTFVLFDENEVPFLAGGYVSAGSEPYELETYKFFRYLHIKQIQASEIRLCDRAIGSGAHVSLIENHYEDLAGRVDFLAATVEEFPEPCCQQYNDDWVRDHLEQIRWELHQIQAFRDASTKPDLPALFEKIGDTLDLLTPRTVRMEA